MAEVDDNYSTCGWGSRRTFLMVILCQITGAPTFSVMPHIAIRNGGTGYIIGYIISYILLGIPLLYMEFVISQFTSRDCIDVWKARACFSHIGYIVVIWQVCILIFNHIFNCFYLHYLLISFERPIPYYTCGEWSTKYCNSILHNNTLNEYCLRQKEPTYYYCKTLFTTYPEYQYWRYHLLQEKGSFHVAWRVTLASALICIFTYISCFKRKESVKWVVTFFTIFPILGYIVVMMWSMVQRGLVTKYEEAIDSDFSTFVNNYRLSNIIQQILYSLGIGTGIPINLASSTSFRAPCYANTVIVVAICVALSALTVCTTAMILCPYADNYSISSKRMREVPMSFVFEKLTRLLSEYQFRSFFLIIFFSCLSVAGMGTNIILITTLVDLATARLKRLEKYPGLTCFFVVLCLFLFTIPLISNVGISTLSCFRRFVNLMTIFVGMIEGLVFVAWYGLGRFSEDVHFMQGIRPGNIMKALWVLTSIILAFVFFSELYHNIIKIQYYYIGDIIGWYAIVIFLGGIVLLCILKMLWAVYKKNFKAVISLDTEWGPKIDVLKRSRCMFTAQAMTKEYMYRQYHLQAGILDRQRRANCRKKSEP